MTPFVLIFFAFYFKNLFIAYQITPSIYINVENSKNSTTFLIFFCLNYIICTVNTIQAYCADERVIFLLLHKMTLKKTFYVYYIFHYFHVHDYKPSITVFLILPIIITIDNDTKASEKHIMTFGKEKKLSISCIHNSIISIATVRFLYIVLSSESDLLFFE